MTGFMGQGVQVGPRLVTLSGISYESSLDLGGLWIRDSIYDQTSRTRISLVPFGLCEMNRQTWEVHNMSKAFVKLTPSDFDSYHQCDEYSTPRSTETF